MELAFVGLQRRISEGAYGIAGQVEPFLRPGVDACLRHRRRLKQAPEALRGVGSRVWASRSSNPRFHLHNSAGPGFSGILFAANPECLAQAAIGQVVIRLCRASQSCVRSRVSHLGLPPAGAGTVSGPRVAPRLLMGWARRNSTPGHRQQVLSAYEPAVAVETADDGNTTLPRSFPWTLIGTLHRPRF